MTESEDGRDYPRQTAELVGHADAERVLLDAWSSGRLPHAWLISGPRGIGKATLAYRFARFVLANSETEPASGGLFGAAPAPRDLTIDPGSPLFRRIAAGGHADFLSIERSVNEKTGKLRGEIPVEDARQIGSFFSLTAAEGGYRVCVVDAVDEMNRHAANALLKILEEPPPRSLLLIVAHAPAGLLPTIRSRCRRLTLRPLDHTDVATVLAKRLPDMPTAEQGALVNLAEGSPGRALALAGSGGLEVYRELAALFARLPEIDIEAMHGFGDRMARRENEAAYRVWADLIGWWLARLARCTAGVMEHDEIVAGEGALLRRLTAGRSLDRWAEVWEKVGRLVERADSVNLDRKQVVINTLFAVARAARA